MKRLRMIFLASFVIFAASASAQNQAPLKLVHTIPLPGLHDGDFDHFTVDLASHRLFSAAEANGEVIVIDTRTNKVLHTIMGLKSPHAMVYRPDLNKLFVVDGDASEIKIYQGSTYQLTGRIPMRQDADSMTYDPATKFMYVVNGGEDAHESYAFVTTINTTNGQKLGEVRINSYKIEALVLEKSGPYLYCNITGENSVGEINRVKHTLVATWPVNSKGRYNSPMAYDGPGHRLLVVTREPGKLIVVDSQSGKIITAMPCVSSADDAVYDAQSRRIYIAGSGGVSVFQQQDPDHYRLIANVLTRYRANTAILVPQLNRYYVAAPHFAGQEAEILVFEVTP
ncbi:MAG: YncE family protein [Terriglobia bacterium]